MVDDRWINTSDNSWIDTSDDFWIGNVFDESLSDGIYMSDSSSHNITFDKTLSDGTKLSEIINSDHNLYNLLQDSIIFNESLLNILNFSSAALTDTISLSDLNTNKLQVVLTATDGFILTDLSSFDSATLYLETATDGLTLSETLSSLFNGYLSVSDSLTLSESSDKYLTISKNSSDSFLLSDLNIIKVQLSLTGLDSFVLSDSAVLGTTTIYLVSASDGFSLSDTSSGILNLQVVNSDNFVLSDSTTKNITIEKNQTDSISLSDSAPTTLNLVNAFTDGFILTESIATDLSSGISLLADDGFKIGDNNSAIVFIKTISSEGFILTDQAISKSTLDLTLTDGIQVSDVITTVGNFVKSCSDTVDMLDELTSVTVYMYVDGTLRITAKAYKSSITIVVHK